MVTKKKLIRQIPPALKAGDRVELVAPAGPFSRKDLESGADVLRSMGFEPVWDKAVFQKRGFFAGTDAHRATMLGRALENPSTKAVWSIRGGYGTARTMGLLPGRSLQTCDKLLVGFSDVTSLLLNLSMVYGLVTIHGPVVTQLPRIPKTHIAWLNRLLTKVQVHGKIPLGATRILRHGKASGILAGGNLSILTSLVGTGLLPSFKGCILFLEDVGEPAYSLDRMWQQLVKSGALRGLRGVVLGELTRCSPARGRWSARSVLERAIIDLGVPALSGAAFGHGKANVAIPMGARAKLNADDNRLELVARVVR